MESVAASSPSTGSRTWILWVSIAAQQLIFLLAVGLRVPLLSISVWVIYVPVVIIWSLYLVVPLLPPKKEKLRAYALTGWIFVLAAASWTGSYIILSEKYGTPVSWEDV